VAGRRTKMTVGASNVYRKGIAAMTWSLLQPPEFPRGGIRLDSILDCKSKDIARIKETEK
jgi:hypothetical protein